MSQIFSQRNILVLEHTTFWVFMYVFVFDYHFVQINWAQAIGSTFIEILSYAILIYMNLWVLIPCFLKQGRLAVYVLSIVLVIVGYICFMRLTGLEDQFYEIGGWRNIFSITLNTSLFLLISTLYWYFKQWQIERERHLVLKSEKLEAELSFLRTQISPHFIFNALNNIYALSLQKHDNAAPMVAKLSSLLRYVLYEGNLNNVLLSREIDTLKQYIELTLLRKPRSQNVDFYIEGSPEIWRITPMVLINFVENAFKHSNIDHEENAWVKINIEINFAGELLFLLENSVSLIVNSNEHSGIGLQNVRRQLEINYPMSHEIIIQNEEGVFQITLKIQLKKV